MSDQPVDPETRPDAELAVNMLRRAEHIAAITHTAPDADAIGGLLGLTLALRSIGLRVTPVCNDDVPSRFKVLPGYADIVRRVEMRRIEMRGVSTRPDLIAALDCADRERMGQIAAEPDWQDVPILNIDHHVTNTRFGQVNWIDVKATATSEIVLSLIDTLNIPLTADIATNLLHGIVGDTLGFRTPHTTPHALECAVRLMDAGANLAETMDQLFNRRTFSQLCMWAMAFNTMKLEEALSADHARVIWTQISKAARRACGQPEWGNSGLSSFLISADEADISAVMTEKDDGQIDVSLRAKRGFDVSGAAQALGGGGHPLAAGTTIDGPLDVAVRRVLTAIKAIRRTAAEH